MKKTYLAILIAIPLLAGSLCAQQLPFHSIYNENWYDINPAFGGMNRFLTVNAMYRAQWGGLAGAPETYRINAHMPLFAAYGGAGMHINSETIGARDLLEVGISYNFVYATPFGILSAGIRPYLTSWNVNSERLRTSSGTYDEILIDHNDPLLANGGFSAMSWNVDFGLHLEGDDFRVGLVSRQLLEKSFDFEGQAIYPSDREFSLYGSYTYQYSKQIRLTGALLLMSNLNQFQSSLRIGGEYQNKYKGNIGLRGFSGNSVDALMLGGGVKVSENFWLNYNYDAGLSRLRNAHSGTHEILIQFRLNRQIGGILPPKVIYNPRFIN